MTGQAWTQIAFFNGCPTTAGTVCVGAVSSSASSKSINATLTAGVTYYIMFDTFPTPDSPCPGTYSLSYLPPNTATAAVIGGLWSNPATWGGTLPNAASTVVIPSGAIVTVDQVVGVVGLSVSGTLQWNGTANAMTVSEDLTIGATGGLLAYTTNTSQTATSHPTINIARNFINEGYANLDLATLNFNGSGSTLSGAGDFQGGTSGIIRNLYFQNTGSNSITTSNNLIVSTTLIHSD